MPKLDNLLLFRCVQVHAPPAIEEPRRRPVLQCQRVDAERSGALPAIPRFHGRQSRAQHRADVRVHPARLSRLRAARARRPGGARRTRVPLLHGSRHRPAPGAEGIGRSFVPLPQGAGHAAAQSRRPPRRATSIPAISPICWRAPASISSPSASKARAWWSICSTSTCASGRASCFRRRGRCGPRPCKARRGETSSELAATGTG